jgi:hypothetical protein
MERPSRRWLLKRLVGTAVVVLAYWIDDVLEVLAPSKPEPRNYAITPGTGSLTLNGGKPVVDVITLADFVNVRLA